MSFHEEDLMQQHLRDENLPDWEQLLIPITRQPTYNFNDVSRQGSDSSRIR